MVSSLSLKYTQLSLQHICFQVNKALHYHSFPFFAYVPVLTKIPFGIDHKLTLMLLHLHSLNECNLIVSNRLIYGVKLKKGIS